MKVCVVIVVAAFFFTNECGIASSQLSALSYADADVGSKLIRPPTTTTATPTTKKSTFFGGIRNLFSRKDATTVSPQDFISSVTPSSNAPSPVTSNAVSPVTSRAIITPPTVPSSTGGSTARSASSSTATSAVPTPSTAATIPTAPPRKALHDFESSATLVLSTPKTPKVKEDFPALPPSRHGPSAGTVSVTPTAIPNAWSNLPAQRPTPPSAWSSTLLTTTAIPSMVNFVPRDPNAPTPATLGTFTVSPDVTTNADLETISEALFAKESTSTFALLTVNYQGRTQSSSQTDEAPEPLLSVNEASLNAIPTVAKMRALHNNYEKDTSVNEYVTAMERNEENDFIDSLLSSSIMRLAMQFLQQKGKVTLDPKSHRDLLKTIWFSMYSRGRGKIGSSAFEHVFVTELKNGTVSGFHNWIYYFYEEQAGNADYKGWLKKVDLGTKGAIVKYRFSYNGIMKPVNAMFVGTSPELEIALYTVCFAVRADKECPVVFGGNKFIIRTHTFRYRGKNLIGSAFPEI